MPRQCGTFGYFPHRTADGRGGPVFVVAALPDVRSRFKRVFPGHKQIGDTGQLVVSATQANARELAWFIDRYPMQPFDAEAAAQLAKLASEHVNGEEQILRILDGHVPDITFRRQPALDPRDYQLIVPAMLEANGFLLLGDDLGLGKTFSSSLILTDPAALPALVVVPGHVTDQWANEELPKYYPWLRTHIIRRGTPYTVAEHRSCKGQEPDVLVTTYTKLYGWADRLAGEIRTIIFDEGDDLRTGDVTDKYNGALQIARRARYRILATATPVHNWSDEMWNLADLLCEGVLGTKEEFKLTWGGKRVTDPRALGQHLRDSGIMLRRTRKEVGRELPPVSQMIHHVETDHDLLKREMDGIIAMAVKILDTAGNQQEKFNLSGQFDLKLRQATGIAKAPYVAAFVRLLLQEEEKVILVGHHHECYNIWKQELAEYNPAFFTGQQTPAQKTKAKQQFITGDSRVLVMAVRSGSGINGLQDVCAVEAFGEVDWSPARHKQIVGRVARDGQTRPVSVFYLMSDGGSDPLMADLLELKRQIGEPITDPDAEVVQPSPEQALKRVQELARGLLRRHGVALPGPGQRRLPDPVPGSGELIAAAELAGPPPTVAVTQPAATASQILEGRTAVPAGTAVNRETLRARLAGDRA